MAPLSANQQKARLAGPRGFFQYTASASTRLARALMAEVRMQ